MWVSVGECDVGGCMGSVVCVCVGGSEMWVCVGGV